ncbi:MAG: CDP-alcohol phosphatidyltransferase family protein [Rhodospirillales bacterium]
MNTSARQWFPLTRCMSYPLVKLLLPLPISANAITAAALGTGLLSAWMFATGSYYNGLAGALLFVLSYLLDNCDGDIARLKNQTSVFGMRFDSFTDWLVNAVFFLAVGWSAWHASENVLWMVFAAFAAGGGTVNYAIDSWRDSRDLRNGTDGKVDGGPGDNSGDRAVYISRILRSDFCFIVLVLALFDVVWFLLPAAAVGAQMYWGMQFWKGFKRHRV